MVKGDIVGEKVVGAEVLEASLRVLTGLKQLAATTCDGTARVADIHDRLPSIQQLAKDVVVRIRVGFDHHPYDGVPVATDFLVDNVQLPTKVFVVDGVLGRRVDVELKGLVDSVDSRDLDGGILAYIVSGEGSLDTSAGESVGQRASRATAGLK